MSENYNQTNQGYNYDYNQNHYDSSNPNNGELNQQRNSNILISKKQSPNEAALPFLDGIKSANSDARATKTISARTHTDEKPNSTYHKPAMDSSPNTSTLRSKPIISLIPMPMSSFVYMNVARLLKSNSRDKSKIINYINLVINLYRPPNCTIDKFKDIIEISRKCILSLSKLQCQTLF